MMEDKMVSTLLPPAARQRLIDAAKTPANEDPLARVKAIEEATRHVRFTYSDYFRPQWTGESE